MHTTVAWEELISEPHVFPLYPRKGVAATTGEQWAQSMRAIAITGAEGVMARHSTPPPPFF